MLTPDGSLLSDSPPPGPPADAEAVAIPAYLDTVYRWAYVNPTTARLLDRNIVVAAILLGNDRRLRRACLGEIAPGSRVLQAGHVYGRFVPDLARRVGPGGRLDVIDVVPLQAALCRNKLDGHANARVHVADAADPRGPLGAELYDAVSAFFLLHEIPDDGKRAVVDALLTRLAPGGKAIFIDYHAPARWHPLRGPFRRLFRRLEPYAESLWNHRIDAFAAEANAFAWRTRTLFGGVYQLTVARRR